MSIVFVLTFAMATVAYATGASPAPSPTNSVSKVITDAVEPVKTQAKEIFFNVIAWFIRAGLAIGLFIKAGGAEREEQGAHPGHGGRGHRVLLVRPF